MKILGLDFTSAPCRAKPITCAEAEMGEGVLAVHGVRELPDFSRFESQLRQAGPWVAGFDFPFGQSQRLIDNLNWPESWPDYVGLVSKLARDEFVTLLEDYKSTRAKGDKEHRRAIDVLAASISPQKLYGVPVGKMFFEGARRLLDTEADIVPVRRQNSTQVVVEAYPAIIARRFITGRSYKNDQKSKQTIELETARQAIVDGLQSPLLHEIYGFSLSFRDDLKRQFVQDASGDTLDAVLCAIQAGWAYLNRHANYGIPEHVNRSEGWIADPKFLYV